MADYGDFDDETGIFRGAPADPNVKWDTSYGSKPFYVVEIEAHQLRELLTGEHVTLEANRGRFAALWRQIAAGTQGGGDLGWWGGLRGMEEAERLVREGWAEGAQRCQELADRLREHLPEPRSQRRKRRWKEDGDEFDRDRFFAGNYDAMWSSMAREVRVAPETIRIVGSWGAPKSWTGEQVFWSGAALLVLTDLLDAADYRTEVLAGSPTTMATGDVLAVARIKEAGEPVRADIIAAAFSHPGCARLFDFASLLTAPFNVDNTLGTIGVLKPAWDKAVSLDKLEEVQVILPRIMDEEQCLAAVTAALAQLIPDEMAEWNFTHGVANA